jgi:formylglycine-generating enzyme required for sulfatase activity
MVPSRASAPGALAAQMKSGRPEAWFWSDWAPLLWVLIVGASWWPMTSLMDTIVRWSKGPGLSRVWFIAAMQLLVSWLVLLGAVAWLSRRWRIPLPKLRSVTELVHGRRLTWWHRVIFIALVAFIATLVGERYHAWLKTPMVQWKDNVPHATGSASPKVPAPVAAKKPSQTGSITPSRCEGTVAHVDNEIRCLRPKDIFRDCPECPEMVVIPAGEFMMGSEEYSEEKPVHKVMITKPFAASKFEVTFDNWDACVIAGGCKHLPDDRSWGRGNRPVMNVSWDDVTKQYLPWLSRVTHETYRLLTEAEWEYAARAGSQGKYTWGDEIRSNRANCDGCGSQWDNKQTAEVGSFQANAFGLHDMHGNVWEWVEDCWHDNYIGERTDGSAWIAGECKARVLRGGSWVNYAVSLRSAARRMSAPVNRSNLTGFRLARTLLDASLPAKDEAAPKRRVEERSEAKRKEEERLALEKRAVKGPVSSLDRALRPEEEGRLKPGDEFQECKDCPRMIVVPAGSFTMGSPSSEPQRASWEQQVRVSIAAPFAVGKFAVTFDEWDACTADGGCNEYKPADRAWGRGKQPVITVNWDDAKAYVGWLSHKTSKTYRLLSETEREYVTRAGTSTPFWWGSSITPNRANYNGNYTYAGGGAKGEYRQHSVPVDSFEPNPWNLYNVHGNVWEWTDDCWNDNNTGNPGDGRARTTGDCGLRVVRGGSWNNSPWLLRSANRFGITTSLRNDYQGFRLARTLDVVSIGPEVRTPPDPARSSAAPETKVVEPPRAGAQAPPNDLIAQALRRVESGDVAGARQMLEAAEVDRQGLVAFALAETYDPHMLAAWGARGVAPDIARARALYRKALSLGVANAHGRLEALK